MSYELFNLSAVVAPLWAVVVVAGLLCALVQRIREIKKGDDDDIGKY